MRELLRRLWSEPATARKFIVAVIGALLTTVGYGLLPAPLEQWVAVIGPFLMAGGVYAVPNRGAYMEPVGNRAGDSR